MGEKDDIDTGSKLARRVYEYENSVVLKQAPGHRLCAPYWFLETLRLVGAMRMTLYFAFVEELWAGLEQYDIAAPLHPANGDDEDAPAAGDEVIVCLRGAFTRNRRRLRIEEVTRLNETHYAVRLRFPMV